MSLLESYVFGLVLGIAIGPIALLILNVSLLHGARSGIACAAGATTADLLFAAAAFVLAAELVPLLQANQLLLQRLAALTLLLFALHMLWQLRKSPAAKPAQPRSARHYYRNTLLLTLVNPLTVLAFASYATRLGGDGNRIMALVHAVIVAAGTGTVAVALVMGAQGLRQVLVNPRWLWALNALSGVGILLFAIRGWIMTLA